MSNAGITERLQVLGFSEYEARAYLALLQKSPVTGYELSKLSGVPRSMIYEVLAKLGARGAALTVPSEGATLHAPVPSSEFLDRLQQEHETLITLAKRDLSAYGDTPDLDVVWNIKSADNILTKARNMIAAAHRTLHLALMPTAVAPLRGSLEQAVERGVRLVLYTTAELSLPGAEVVVASLTHEALDQAGALALILVVDSKEVLVSEGLMGDTARASWTLSPLLVFIAEHHLRTDLYLPRLLTLLGDRALDVIRPDDRALFAQVLESHVP